MNMGQGKTAVICAFISRRGFDASIVERWFMSGAKRISGSSTVGFSRKIKCLQVCVIVVSVNIIGPWMAELAMWGIRFQRPKGGELKNLSEFPVIITTEKNFRDVLASLPENPNVVVIDEPDTVKIVGVLSFTLDEPSLVVLVSATLGAPIAQAPTHLKIVKVFNTIREEFPEIVNFKDSSYRNSVDLDLPEPIITRLKLKVNSFVQKLSEFLPSHSIDLLKAGATLAFMDSIGEGERKSIGDVIASISEKIQKEIDDAEEKIQSAAESAGAGQGSSNLQKEIDGLRAKKERLTGFDEELVTCDICCEENLSPTRPTSMCTQCLNIFCAECLNEWIKSTPNSPGCPMCRSKLEDTMKIALGGALAAAAGGSAAGGSAAGGSAAGAAQSPNPMDCISEFESVAERSIAEIVLRTLTKVSGASDQVKKILVAGNHPECIDLISTLCGKINLKCDLLRGSEKARSEIMDAFVESADSSVLVVGASDSSAGMNLPVITHCIIVGSIDETRERQIIGRGQRPGRVGRQEVIIISLDLPVR